MSQSSGNRWKCDSTGTLFHWLICAALMLVLNSSAVLAQVATDKKSAKPSVGKDKTTVSATGVPITGPGSPVAAIDDAMLRHMERSRCTAGTIAVSKHGELLYSRGYGWCDQKKSRATQSDTPMRIASISKPITAAAIRKLVASEHLDLQTKVLPLFAIKPSAGKPIDPRWSEITVEHLLDHKGGWDIAQLGFDPMFESNRAAQELRLSGLPTSPDIIRWMMTKPMQFAPGERRAYSNFGYCVLGRVIERAAKKPYLKYVQEEIFRPVGIGLRDVRLAVSDPSKRDSREPWYPDNFLVDVMDAHGGLVISSPTLCQFLENYWISGSPRRPDENGAVYTFFGSMPGTSAIAHQRSDGISFACAFNNRHSDADLSKFTEELNQLVDASLR